MFILRYKIRGKIICDYLGFYFIPSVLLILYLIYLLDFIDLISYFVRPPLSSIATQY